MGCHALLQGIFPTQGSNPGLRHCRQSLGPPSHQGRELFIKIWLKCRFLQEAPPLAPETSSGPLASSVVWPSWHLSPRYLHSVLRHLVKSLFPTGLAALEQKQAGILFGFFFPSFLSHHCILSPGQDTSPEEESSTSLPAPGVGVGGMNEC